LRIKDRTEFLVREGYDSDIAQKASQILCEMVASKDPVNFIPDVAYEEL
jgi:hypothetical protein